MNRLFWLFLVLSSFLCAGVYSEGPSQFDQMRNTIDRLEEIGKRYCTDLGYKECQILNCSSMVDLKDSGNISFMFHFPRKPREDEVIVTVKDGFHRMEILLFEPMD